MSTALTNRRFAALVLLAVAWIGGIAYWNATANDFVWDDVSSFLVHKDVHDPAKIAELFKKDQHAYGRGEGRFYRPLLSVTFMADFYLANRGAREAGAAGIPAVAPFVFHLSSALWHIAAAAALFLMLAVFRAPRMVQALVPLLYAVHPLHTEAVAYISGRADSMAAAFIFLGMAAAFSPRLLPEGARARRFAWPAASLAAACCVFAGALSKESGAMLLPLLLLAAFVLLRCEAPAERPKPWPLAFLPFTLGVTAILLYAALRNAAVGGAAESAAAATPLAQRLVETAQALALYMQLVVAPGGLHMERTLDGAGALHTALGAAAALALLAACAIGLYRRRLGLAMGAGLFLLAWLPISGLIPLNAPMAEHWLYVPLAGLLWAVFDRAAAWTPAPAARGLVYGAAALFCLLWLDATAERNREWRDNVTLFEATLRENPNTLRVHYNLAVAYESVERSYPPALRHYGAVAAMAQQAGPGALRQELEAYYYAGQVLLADNRPQEAYAQFQRILEKGGRDEQSFDLVAAAILAIGESLIDAGEAPLAADHFAHWTRQIPALAPEAEQVLTGETLPLRFL